MAQYEGITYTRQDAFAVEEDMLCKPFDMQIGEAPMKIAYHLCGDAALIGEFVISEAGRNEIIREGQRVFERLCGGQRERLSLLDGRVLVVACVLLARNSINASDEEKGSERDKIWQPLLDGLDFQNIAARTGCSENAAKKHLCDMLKNRYNVRFFANSGHMYYNTLRLHALAPERSIKNLYNVLYAFYHTNLKCNYDPGSAAAPMLVKGIRRRWDDSETTGRDRLDLPSDHLYSGLRELFRLRPNYMAAVCDALLDRIDRIVQGDLTMLSARNRWDALLWEWYTEKTAYERKKMQRDRKTAVKQKIVDRKENIRATYRYENGKIYLCVPGIRLPEIRQMPVLRLYQNGRLIQQRNMSFYGNDVLYSTHALEICLNEVASLNWKQHFRFEIHIQSGENEIYRSSIDLFREYLCFTPAGNETRLIRCDQILRLIVRKAGRVVIDDPYDEYTEEAAPFRSYGLVMRTVRRVTINGEDILQERPETETKRIWPYLMPEPDPKVTAKFGEETVAVYADRPVLYVPFRDPTDAKNYQLTLNGVTEQLYQYPWVDGQYRIPLPALMERRHQIQLKAFDSGKVVFQHSYTIVPGLTYAFDQPFYLDTAFSGKLIIKADRRRMSHPFQLQPDSDKVTWNMAGVNYEISAPVVRARINGGNAFDLPERVWHEELKTAFLTIHMPEEVSCEALLGNKVLTPQKSGTYEIGAEIRSHAPAGSRKMLSLRFTAGDVKLERKLTDVCFQAYFEVSPIVQNGRELLWDPLDAGYMGGRDPVFCILLENDQKDEPFRYTQFMKPDRMERDFPCRTGTYKYTIWLTERGKVSDKYPGQILLEGAIRVEDPPEIRFEGRCLDLTDVYYNDPVTGEDVSAPMQTNAARIRFIRYEGEWEIDGEMRHEYSGEMYFCLKNRWIAFKHNKDKLFEKNNPVFFYVKDDEHLHVYLADDATLMLNLKVKDGIQIFSRRAQLSQKDQMKYLGFADQFRFLEQTDEKER